MGVQRSCSEGAVVEGGHRVSFGQESLVGGRGLGQCRSCISVHGISQRRNPAGQHKRRCRAERRTHNPPVTSAGHQPAKVAITLPVTYLSQTCDPGPDLDVLRGQVMDPELRKWIRMDPLDVRHATTD